ncbi:MAG: porin [Pseudomonadota bacterium]
MKKQLLCTSAIALGVAAAPAAAQDWNLDWGGFFNTHVAVSDISTNLTDGQDFDGDGLDVHTNTEIIFTPSITLDNGLTFGVNIQFEGSNTESSEIDESYASISSDTFGRLDVGAENSAGYKLMTGAPSVTSMFINSPSTSTFIPFTATGTEGNFRQAFLSSFTEVGGNNDVNRITYYTPDFNGLTIGVSYAPTGDINVGNSLSVDKRQVVSDIFDIGVNYSGSFGTTDVTLAARYGTGDAATFETTGATAGGDGLDGTSDDTDGTIGAIATPASDPETWGIGASVTFGAVTVGGSYSENDNGAADGDGDQEGWSFGVVYDAAGPWAFEALTYQGEIKGTGADGDLDREAYKIGASRDLGPGVDWDIYLVYEERDFEGTAGTEVEGTTLGTAINLSF